MLRLAMYVYWMSILAHNPLPVPHPCRRSCLLLGARVRHSARGKGHEEGGSTYAKVGSSLRSPPGNPRASTPINQSLPTLLLCALTYTSDFTGGCPPPFGEGVNLELQLIIIPGHDRSVSTYKLL